MPLWTVFALLGAAYLVRSAVRGFDFAPEMPTDAFVAVAALLVTAAVAWLRADDARRDSDQADDAGVSGVDS